MRFKCIVLSALVVLAGSILSTVFIREIQGAYIYEPSMAMNVLEITWAVVMTGAGLYYLVSFLRAFK